MFPNLSAALGMFWTTLTALFSGCNEFAEAFEKSGKIVNDKAKREYDRHKSEMDQEQLENKEALRQLRDQIKQKREAQLAAKEEQAA